MSSHDAVRGPAAAALVHTDATGTGLIDTVALDEAQDGLPEVTEEAVMQDGPAERR